MPTVLRQEGFSIRIYTADHEPAHVHVRKGESEAKVSLLDATLIEEHRTSPRDMRRILEIVEANQRVLLEAWVRIHGG